jgi:hypothetical protein
VGLGVWVEAGAEAGAAASYADVEVKGQAYLKNVYVSDRWCVGL